MLKLDVVIDLGKKNRDGSPKNEHLLKIANMMDSWKGTVAEALELGNATQAAITAGNSNFADQKYVVCLEWGVMLQFCGPQKLLVIALS